MKFEFEQYLKLAFALDKLKLINFKVEDRKRDFTPDQKKLIIKLSKKQPLDNTAQKKNKKLLKQLRKDGFKLKKFDLRKKLTYHDLGYIDTLNRKIKTVANYRTEFVRKYISVKNANIFKGLGYVVVNKRSVFIPKNNYKTVKIGQYDGHLAVIREMPLKKPKNYQGKWKNPKAKKQQIDIIIPKSKIINYLQELTDKYPDGLPDGMTITARASTDSPFNFQLNNVYALMYYITNTWAGKDDPNAISVVSIVLIK